jgi:predicted MFS family arabinose efflux permease
MSLAGAMLVGAAAMLVLGIQPELLGALADEGRLPAAALGRLAMVEVFALAAGSAIGPYWMTGRRIRTKTTLVCIGLAVACFGIYAAHTLVALYVLRALAGIFEGLAVGSTIAIVTHTRHPDRVNGVLLAVATIPQILAAYLLPVAITPRWGGNAGFGLLGAFALISTVGAFRLVSPPQRMRHIESKGWLRSPAVLIALMAVVTQNAGIGAAWNYIEQLGSQHRFAPDEIGLALSASLGFQVVGAFFVSWVGWRTPHRLALLAGVVLQTAVVLALAQTDHFTFYFFETCVFGLFWLALQPFQIQQLIMLDPSRRAVLLVMPLSLVGLSLGPLLASFVVSQGDVRNAFWMAAAIFGLSAILFQGASWNGRSPRKSLSATANAASV